MGLGALIGRLFGGGKTGKASAKGPMISLVFLRRKPKVLGEAQLAAAAAKVLHFAPQLGPEATEFVLARPPMSMIKTRNWAILVNEFPTPYFENVERLANQIRELRLRDAVIKHRAWMSCDVVQRPPSASIDEAYRVIGALMAELADDDCSVVVDPEEQLMQVVDTRVLEMLRLDPKRAVRQLTQVPVTQIQGDDPRLKSAVNEARRRLPEFVRAFEQQDGNAFAVKVPVTVGNRTEFIWLSVEQIDSKRFHGKLGNDPVDLGALREGDPMAAPIDDLNDWVYMKDGNMMGGFTVKVLMSAAKGK